jgi:DNA repair exonuclease SbcCD nuclease subunit
MENTYVVLMDSLDTIYNGYAVGVYDREKGTIKFNPKSIKFPFDPVTKKIVRETEDDFEDNTEGLKLVRTSLYYREEEQGKNETKIKNPSDSLEEESITIKEEENNFEEEEENKEEEEEN